MELVISFCGLLLLIPESVLPRKAQQMILPCSSEEVCVDGSSWCLEREATPSNLVTQDWKSGNLSSSTLSKSNKKQNKQKNATKCLFIQSFKNTKNDLNYVLIIVLPDL